MTRLFPSLISSSLPFFLLVGNYSKQGQWSNQETGELTLQPTYFLMEGQILSTIYSVGTYQLLNKIAIVPYAIERRYWLTRARNSTFPIRLGTQVLIMISGCSSMPTISLNEVLLLTLTSVGYQSEVVWNPELPFTTSLLTGCTFESDQESERVQVKSLLRRTNHLGSMSARWWERCLWMSRRESESRFYILVFFTLGNGRSQRGITYTQNKNSFAQVLSPRLPEELGSQNLSGYFFSETTAPWFGSSNIHNLIQN